MRKGYNPQKDKLQQKTDYFHQIIIPVYIPNLQGYFKDSLKVFNSCIVSLNNTVHNKTYITVVNNGSSVEVATYLNSLLSENKIHELIHTHNIGKLNAILKGIVGHRFDLITVTDSDVLFLNNWQEATYAVFRNFRKAGFVCTTPSPRSYNTHTANIWFEKILSKSLQFTKVKNPMALRKFAESIDSPNFYNKYHLAKYLTITNNNLKAVVGAGHFVGTYRGDIFNKIDLKYSPYSLGGDSETEILDLPVLKAGLWRLSTEDNYTYHMGNVFEDWMIIEETKIPPKEYGVIDFKFQKVKSNYVSYWIKNKLFRKFLLKKNIIKHLKTYKGLEREEVKMY